MFLAALAVISALGTVVQRNPVHCLLALVVTLLTIAVIFIGLDAVTVGFLQAIVYAGAIMVLFLFVVWLLNLQAELRSVPGYLALKAIAGLLCAALVAELFVLLGYAPSAGGAQAAAPTDYGSIEALATTLFSDYLIAFEVTSVLLLAAIVGAIALARRTPSSQAASARRVAAAECAGRVGGGRLTMVPMSYFVGLSAVLFAIGVAGVLLRRNVIVIFMSIEIMLNAVNLAFVALGRRLGSMDGQVIVFFVMTVAAAEAAVGLAIIISIFRNRETVNADELNLMRW